MIMVVPMMFLVPADVIGRYLLNKPLPAVFEVNSYFLMVAVVFFPLAYVHQKNEHVFVNLFTRRWPKRLKSCLDLVSMLLGAAAFGLIGWFGLKTAIKSTAVMEYIPGIINIPIWISKWFVPLGAFVFTIELLRNGYGHLLTIINAPTKGE